MYKDIYIHIYICIKIGIYCKKNSKFEGSNLSRKVDYGRRLLSVGTFYQVSSCTNVIPPAELTVFKFFM